jgi:hypothetical protein
MKDGKGNIHFQAVYRKSEEKYVGRSDVEISSDPSPIIPDSLKQFEPEFDAKGCIRRGIKIKPQVAATSTQPTNPESPVSPHSSSPIVTTSVARVSPVTTPETPKATAVATSSASHVTTSQSCIGTFYLLFSI